MSLSWIRTHFPVLAGVLPAGLEPETVDPRRAFGDTTHPGAVDEQFLGSSGGAAFAAADVPEGFVWAGIQAAGSEYLCVMWVCGGRKFWFYDQYFNLAGDDYPAVNARLGAALAAWAAGTGDVIVSRLQGPWDPVAKRFARG